LAGRCREYEEKFDLQTKSVFEIQAELDDLKAELKQEKVEHDFLKK